MKRVLSENCSIVRRSAACASSVSESASSRNTIRKSPPNDERANPLIRSRTTSIPRWSEALSSKKFPRQLSSPYTCRAMAVAAVVLPVPAGPQRAGGDVVLLDVALEPFDDRLLPVDVVERLGSVLLDPDLPTGRGRSRLLVGLAHGGSEVWRGDKRPENGTRSVRLSPRVPYIRRRIAS